MGIEFSEFTPKIAGTRNLFIFCIIGTVYEFIGPNKQIDTSETDSLTPEPTKIYLKSKGKTTINPNTYKSFI